MWVVNKSTGLATSVHTFVEINIFILMSSDVGQLSVTVERMHHYLLVNS